MSGKADTGEGMLPFMNLTVRHVLDVDIFTLPREQDH